MKISYLGPKGTHTEKAAKELALKISGAELVPKQPLEAVAKSVAQEEADLAVMAFYNKIDGLVQECLDYVYKNNLFIIDAHRLPIVHAIGSKGEHSRLYSHPKALAQCSQYLWDNHPDLPREPAISTAAAAENVSKTGIGLAIADIDALKLYGLDIIAQDIGNLVNGRINYTDFYLVARNNEHAPDFGKSYNTMLALTPHTDRAGLLLEVLTEISSRGLSLSDLHSRPAPKDIPIGDIEPKMFYVEVMAHQSDAVFTEGINAIRKKLAVSGKDAEIVRILGSYERHPLP